MKDKIADLDTDGPSIRFAVLGRTPGEALDSAREVISHLKEVDPSAIFKHPRYLGFDRAQRHAHLVVVIPGGPHPPILEKLDAWCKGGV